MDIYDNGKVSCTYGDFIAWVRIDSPPANAIDSGVVDGLSECFELLYEREDVRAVIVTGTGNYFAAGADIGEFVSWNTPEIAEAMTKKGQDLFLRIEQYPAPVIAAVNGYALGGGLELALSCDVRLAADTAKMGFPEVTLGIIPGYGGTQRLFRAVGPGMAKKMIFAAEKLSAEEAYSIGLVQRVVEAARLEEAAEALAAAIAQNGPAAVRTAKACIDAGRDLTLTEGLKCELEGAKACFATEDKKEGVTAFLEKRPAVFKGR